MQRLRWLAIVIAAALWCGPATAHESKVHTAALLVDATSGQVLEAENANHLWYPASLTKVMTAYLVFEALADGRLALDQKVPVSKEAAAQPPTKLGLGVGKKVRVALLLETMIVRSSNDAAVVLAEAVSGSEEAFARAMTRKARSLGMTQTFFANATGLPDEAQVTTARDMVILARALLANLPRPLRTLQQTVVQAQQAHPHDHQRLDARLFRCRGPQDWIHLWLGVQPARRRQPQRAPPCRRGSGRAKLGLA